MRNPLYRKNGKRNFVVGGLMALAMAIGGTVACGSSEHTSSVACAGTAQSVFTLTNSSHGGTSSGSSGTSRNSNSGTQSTNGGSSGTNGNNGSNNSGSGTSRYGSNGGNNGGTNATNGSSGTNGTNSNRYGNNGGTSTNTGSTFDKNAKTGLSGTVKMPSSIPAPPRGTTRVTAPGESAYTPPSNKVQQPKHDIQAAQASVQNRRFVMKSGSHYRSPVTKHVYYYHPRSYYTSSVYQDLYNPYDGRNYLSSGYGTAYGQFSPYWNLVWATMLVGSCS